ncbi:hypothetical protein ABEG18_06805 [Alsobacter sp. KACC 23698]|uniref:Uncharacterized protein n=1 Tax=Alsobacter sp. KACC 23698 TaxID=3149229 RepID=A0AAU7JJH3_9HYPH
MYAVARTYSGVGAKEFMSLLESRIDEIEKMMVSVDGFETYTLFRTEDGGMTVTLCRDKAGVDKSVEIARKWVSENAAQTKIGAPKVSSGEVILACGTLHRVAKTKAA